MASLIPYIIQYNEKTPTTPVYIQLIISMVALYF